MAAAEEAGQADLAIRHLEVLSARAEPAGRVQALGALVGQVMKLTRGTANPKVVHALIQRQLDA